MIGNTVIPTERNKIYLWSHRCWLHYSINMIINKYHLLRLNSGIRRVVIQIKTFSGLKLENYIQKDLSNVTLTVLEGEVIVEIMGRPNTTMQIGDYVHIPTQTFHTVWSVSDIPSCYMYVYTNNTMPRDVTQDPLTKKPLFPLLEETGRRWNNTKKAVNIVSEAVLNIFCSVSMI